MVHERRLFMQGAMGGAGGAAWVDVCDECARCASTRRLHGPGKYRAAGTHAAKRQPARYVLRVAGHLCVHANRTRPACGPKLNQSRMTIERGVDERLNAGWARLEHVASARQHEASCAARTPCGIGKRNALAPSAAPAPHPADEPAPLAS
jgi:hypothetical protein